MFVILCLLFLYVYSFSFQYCEPFSKEKVQPLKAILAILIVVGHLIINYINFPSFLSQWLTPSVSIFLFISGYGLIKSYILKGNDYLKGFFKIRIWGILVPFLLADLIYVLLVDGFYNVVILNEIPDYISMMMNLKKIEYFPFTWYVFCILYLYVSFFLTFKFIPSKLRLYTLLLLSILYIVYTKGRGYGIYWYISTLAFPAGAFYAKYESVFLCWYKSKKVYFLSVPIAIGLIYLLSNINSEYGLMLAYIIIPIVIVALLSKLPIEKLNYRPVLFLGGISYEFYLVQAIPMDLFRRRFYIQSDILYILTVFLSILILAYLVHKLAGLMKFKK